MSWRLAPPVLVGLAVLLGQRPVGRARGGDGCSRSRRHGGRRPRPDAMLEGGAVPGGAFAVVHDGAIVHLAAFGEASRAGR